MVLNKGKQKIVKSISKILMESIFNERTLFNVKTHYGRGLKYRYLTGKMLAKTYALIKTVPFF